MLATHGALCISPSATVQELRILAANTAKAKATSAGISNLWITFRQP